MILYSKYNIGDKVWVPIDNMPFLGTVGKITMEHTNSKGIPGEDTFHNYMAQRKDVETYMLEETGIGSGLVLSVDKCFDNQKDCENFIKQHIERNK